MAESVGPLPERMVEKMALVCGGHTHQEAADVLYVSRETVKNAMHDAYKRLGVTGRGPACYRFAKLGGVAVEREPDGETG